MKALVDVFLEELQRIDPSGMYDVSGDEITFDVCLSRAELENVLRRTVNTRD